MSEAGVVIVGGGHAGFEAAAALRAGGYAGPVRLLSAEVLAPYQRPPLSKGLLLGKADAYNLPFRSANYYEASRIELRLGETATAIDPARRQVVTSGGATLAYDALILATGARPRPLPLPGAELEGVLALRTLDDAQAIAAGLATAEQVVVIGGGFIGLEVAAAARLLGKPATVLEAADRVMGRAVSPVVSAFFDRLHRGHGVSLRLDARVERLLGEAGRVRAVLADGLTLPADLVVVGVGVLPNMELAASAGLACSNGIEVDAHARTSDPAIWAAGDCALHPNRLTGSMVRLESVQNATDQARTAAASILGRHEPYHAVPWFWSDQYDAKLQMTGLSRGHDRSVLRGDPDSGRFAVFYYTAERLIAVDTVSRPGDHLAGRRLLAAGLSPTPDQVADPAFDLKAAAARGTV